MTDLYYHGRTIYYDKESGYVIYDSRDVATTESDYKSKINPYVNIINLSERVKESIGEIELEYEQFKEDFDTCNGYRVNPITKELEFSYPDPNVPESPMVFRESLSDTVQILSDYVLDVDYRLIMMELGI